MEPGCSEDMNQHIGTAIRVKPKVRYQNVQRSIDNAVQMMELGKEKRWDLIFIAEPWKRNLREKEGDPDIWVTTMHTSWDLLTAPEKDSSIVAYQRKGSKIRVKLSKQKEDFIRIKIDNMYIVGLYLNPELRT